MTRPCLHRDVTPAKADDWFRCACGELLHRKELRR